MSSIFTVYHTCHLEGSLKSIFENSPYKCTPTAPQWLGNGYYFWTDSDFFAHKWGKQKGKYPKGYAITEYLVEIPENSLLDLVGNVKDQLIFVEQIKIYVERMGIELGSKSDAKNIPISKVLDHFRALSKSDQSKFKYDAIKAMDYSSVETYLYKFTEEANQQELIPIPSRQQLFLNDLFVLKNKKLFCAIRVESRKYKNICIHNKENFIFDYKGS